jgi:cytochrome c peroxidase
MKKKSLLLLVFASTFIILLQNCRQDKTEPPANPVDPDSLYVGTPATLKTPRKFPPIEIPSNITLTKEGIQLGRMLFYDKVLSSDSQFACASCHKQQYAFSDGGNALSQNVFGLTKRNSPPLFNLVWMKSYFWDGRATTLQLQAADAMEHELNFIDPNVVPKLQAKPQYVYLFKKAFGRPGTITNDKVSNALTQFMLTLISAESRFDSVMRFQATFTNEEFNGFYNLFQKDPSLNSGVGADCFHCHASTSGDYLTMIDNGFHNNSLDASNGFQYPDNGQGVITGNQLDNGKFKTPHIRNIELTGPYMRDGRFTTLEQVVNFYNDSLKITSTHDPFMKFESQGGLHSLSDQDKSDLIAFLKTLTDWHFVNDTSFSNPFH